MAYATLFPDVKRERQTWYYPRTEYLDDKDFDRRCFTCNKLVAFYTVTDMGSRGYGVSTGFWCKKKKGLLCGDSDPTAVTAYTYCSDRCAGCNARLYARVQNPHVSWCVGSGTRFRFTHPAFCGEDCDGTCVEKEKKARKEYETILNTKLDLISDE